MVSQDSKQVFPKLQVLPVNFQKLILPTKKKKKKKVVWRYIRNISLILVVDILKILSIFCEVWGKIVGKKYFDH